MKTTFQPSPTARTGGVEIAESTLNAAYGNPLNAAYACLPNPQKAAPTRSQFAAALREAYPGAFVYVGGRHVALHMRGEHTARDVMFTGSGADWR